MSCLRHCAGNTVYIERSVQALRDHGVEIPEEHLKHLSPLGWEHIGLTGEYRWHLEEATALREVFMSSHVLSEVEDVADSVAILRSGRLVAVEDITTLKQRAVHRMEICFDAPVPPSAFTGLPGVREVQVDGDVLQCVVEGRADALVKAAGRFTVLSLRSRESDLEETFLTYYADKEGDRYVA
ncbi:MAG: Tn3 family transposase [Chloroflexota bacterium]|nr:Tn3 family transposase [Chloroflexota bacterium]